MIYAEEVEALANQYGGIGKANKGNRREVDAILEPVFSGQPADRVRALRTEFSKRAIDNPARYGDLAQFLKRRSAR